MKKYLSQIFHTRHSRSAWRSLIHLWKPMAIWTLFVWAIVAIILAPVSSAVLGLQFFRSGNLIVGNEDLLSWLLSPVGLGYILLAAALSLTAWVIRFAGLSQIVTDDIHGKKVSSRDIIIRISSKIHLLFRLCLTIVTAGLLFALPLLAGLGFIYEYYLNTYDINYYLSETPLEWHLALLTSTAWFVIWLLGAMYCIARSILTLPTYLHSQKSVRESFIYAWNLDFKQSKSNLKIILVITGIWLFVGLTAAGIFFVLSTGVINWMSHYIQSVRFIALSTGIYVIGSLMLDALISFLGFSHVSILITKLYYQEVGISTKAPSSRPKLKKLTSFLGNALRPKILVSIIAVAILSSVVLSGYMITEISKSTSDSDIKVIAHRAGPPPAPENTLQALDLTFQTDAEYAEIDVQLSNDSVVVVAHDLDLMRMANNPAQISETNFNELQNILDKKGRAKINTLDDFLEAAQGQIKLMIELKQNNTALISRTVKKLRQKEMIDGTIILSLNLESLRKVQDIAPEVATGYISAFTLGDISQLPVGLLAINQRSISKQLINQAQNRNLEVYAWTVNEVPGMAHMIEYGVDGIITDNPKLAIQVRREMQELTVTERLLLQFQQLVVVERE
ncbi:hypothetical protein LQ318_15005 [Aliifodinibius salicampi]|uniref:GP-PDE domain-containing protein n=1 Tax=Fodinibius salicampi TaxID=1920655 RepID=A0ABT3Q297_9BACT|nr:glycerophosphodiester phosphodiesterase family protein [Fodinibius salicampi]MCW9714218.1 hypothetical protein [Fodinibius salicampi]